MSNKKYSLKIAAYVPEEADWTREQFDKYAAIRDARKKYLKENFSGPRSRKKRKRPWYELTSGKQVNYEERTEKYGQAVQFYRVKSETLQFNEKYTIHRTDKCEVTLRTMQDRMNTKMRKWEGKHVDPMNEPPTLFTKQFHDEWVDARQKEVQRIRDLLILKYHTEIMARPSVSNSNVHDAFMAAVYSLSPKLVTMTQPSVKRRLESITRSVQKTVKEFLKIAA